MSDIIVSTEPLTPELLQQVAYLYANEHYKTYLWPWQFKYRFGRQPLGIIARAEGKVIGFNGTMPIKLITASGAIVEAIWSCDFIVAKAYRGKGVGTAIKDEMLAKFPCPIMSLGISDSAYPLLLKKGWKSPVALNVLQYVGRPQRFKQYLFKSYSLLKRVIFFTAIDAAKNTYYCDELAELPQKNVIDFLWSLPRAEDELTEVYRDYDYLKWRYKDYPLGEDQYRYLSVGSKEKSIVALVVFRISLAKNIEVVDFVGNHADPAIVVAAANHLIQIHSSANVLTWNTSSKNIATALSQCGFIKKKYSARFVVRSADSKWNLVAGDSDGDLLKVAREGMLVRAALAARETSAASPSLPSNLSGVNQQSLFSYQNLHYRIVERTEDFSALRHDWDSLLARSAANPLFMSWSWQYAWWITWGSLLNLNLYLLTIYDGDKLCGIIPLYRYKSYGINCLQFIGNAWGIAQTIRSEYIGPLFAVEQQSLLTESFRIFFKTLSFNTRLTVPDTTDNLLPGVPAITKRTDYGYRVNVTGSFANYVSGLGAQTRLKAFNRRKYLQQLGHSIVLADIHPDAGAIRTFLSTLNSFHLLRWGKPCFNRQAIAFHTWVLLSMPSASPRLSYLMIDDVPVSCSYNILVCATVYNIQSGYLEYYDKKISLGTMHMGWGIERSFADTETNYFDFLAGFGKVEDYKKHYRGELVVFNTVQYFNSRLMRQLTSLLLLLKNSARKIRHSIKAGK